ncbi:MAG: homocysteine S-methyltransferase family protein, partial [Planctomycetota bacterium]
MLDHPFRPFLDDAGFVLLDGGLSTELERQGHGAGIDHPLWTARLLRDAPEAISAAHAAFLAAGADCVISASYQASVRGLVEDGCDAA